MCEGHLRRSWHSKRSFHKRVARREQRSARQRAQPVAVGYVVDVALVGTPAREEPSAMRRSIARPTNTSAVASISPLTFFANDVKDPLRECRSQVWSNGTPYLRRHTGAPQ